MLEKTQHSLTKLPKLSIIMLIREISLMLCSRKYKQRMRSELLGEEEERKGREVDCSITASPDLACGIHIARNL